MREQKSSIRQILRQRKDALEPVERLKKSTTICSHLMTLISDHETVIPPCSR